MGWFNLLMTEFIVACVEGYYFSPIHIPFLLPPCPLSLSTPVTQAKFIVVSGRKDGVDLEFDPSLCSYFRSTIWLRERSYFASKQGLPV